MITLRSQEGVNSGAHCQRVAVTDVEAITQWHKATRPSMDAPCLEMEQFSMESFLRERRIASCGDLREEDME